MNDLVNIGALYGYSELYSWQEVEGNRIIGMCKVVHRDRNGVITSDKTEPSGLVMYWPEHGKIGFKYKLKSFLNKFT